MKVILTQDVKNLGKKGEMVSTSDGYARNFLFPRKLAVEANAQSLTELKNRENAKNHKIELEIEAANESAGKINGKTVKITAKAGQNGKLFGSVTSGIVSALNREISINDKDMTLIQTDAAINNGNSGGPLLNSCGQVIGINSAKMSSSYGTASVEGLGFAIPINEAKEIIDDLINYNYVKGRPQIGITTVDVDESYSSFFNIPMGVYVRTVQEGSAADLAGIQVGDVIIDVDGTAVKTREELTKIKNEHKAGETITITVTRNGEDVKLNLVLQEATGG